MDEYVKITKEKVGEKELKKAKEHLKGSLALGLEDSREVASLFGAQQLLEGKFRSLEEISKNIDKVTAEEIQSVAEEIFVNDNLNLTVIGPYKSEEKFVKILKL